MIKMSSNYTQYLFHGAALNVAFAIIELQCLRNELGLTQGRCRSPGLSLAVPGHQIKTTSIRTS